MNIWEIKENIFKKLSWVFDFSKIVVVLVVVILIIHFFIATIFVVSGESMEPNLHNGEFLLVNRLNKQFSRGDIIGFYYPGFPSNKFVKRVIGLPGEKVRIKNNKIIIYNRQNPKGIILEESFYLPSGIVIEPEKMWQVGNEEYFVIGDNRTNSIDSRFFGPLPRKYIVGRAIIILWPIRMINIIKRVQYLYLSN